MNKNAISNSDEPIYIHKGLSNHPFSLPIFIPWKLKWPIGILVLVLSAGIYLFTNHSITSPSRVFNLTWIDESIPFLPWTVWIYASGAIYLPIVYLLNRCVVSLNKHLYSFMLLIVTSDIIFWVYPTSYPRDLYPNPSHLDPWTFALLNGLRNLDGPGNCAPSLHVSISFLTAFGFLEDRKEYFPIIFLWATLLSISTLTTKQHYLIDVVSGFIFSVIFFYLFHRLFSYKLKSKTLGPIDISSLN